MHKKIISFICVLMFVCTTSGMLVSADKSVNDTYTAEKLQALGVMTEEKKITYDAFVYSLAGFLYENPESMGTAANIAFQTGMIDTPSDYNGGIIITFNDAIRYAVVTLGYKTRAMELGGDVNSFITVGSQLGLLKNVEASGEDVILFADAVTILENMLDAEPMVSYYNNEYDKGYMLADGETLLSLNRDIYEVKGMMTANENTSIYGIDGTVEGRIKIGESEYGVLDNCNVDFLGQNILAYVKEDSSGEQTVIYICSEEKKNEIITLDADVIDNVASDFSAIEYFGENGRIRRAKLDIVPSVIFNGVFYDKYTMQDLTPDTGSITLIDNNKDGKYDVVYVTLYQTVIVEGINSTDHTIYNKYKFDGAVPKVKLDEEEIDYIIYDSEGKEAEFTDIKFGDVLSIAKSKNDEEIIIYISGKEKIPGAVTSLKNEDKELIVDGNEYKMTDEFIKYLTEDKKNVTVGNNYIFSVDYFGKIVYMEASASSDYYLFYKIYEEDEKYYVKCMDVSSTWKTLPLSKNVKYNGEKGSQNYLYEVLKNIEPQVVKLRVNSKDEISAVEIAKISTEYVEDMFTKCEGTYTYRRDANTFNMVIYPEKNAKLFVFPENKNAREDYYVRSAAGFFGNNGSYALSCYDQDEFGFCPVFSITDTESLQMRRVSTGLFVVTGAYDKLVDDDVVSVIQGNYGEFMDLTIIGDNEKIFSGIKVGDVVNVGLNIRGRANYVKKFMSLEEFAFIDPINYFQDSAVLAGTVEKIVLEKERIKVNCGHSVSFRISPTTTVQIYNKSTRNTEMKTASELVANDKVVCRLTAGIISEIVCIREG